MIYADTSFLFSLVLHDVNTAAAKAYLRRHHESLILTPWQRYELRNAVRLSVWRENCPPTIADGALEQIDADIAGGSLSETVIDWTDVLERAEGLSALHTTAVGVRSLDLFHVAAAISLKVKIFLTFDARQFSAAKAAGLNARIP
jgi:predicted nucleic acid-binding protein